MLRLEFSVWGLMFWGLYRIEMGKVIIDFVWDGKSGSVCFSSMHGWWLCGRIGLQG